MCGKANEGVSIHPRNVIELAALAAAKGSECPPHYDVCRENSDGEAYLPEIRFWELEKAPTIPLFLGGEPISFEEDGSGFHFRGRYYPMGVSVEYPTTNWKAANLQKDMGGYPSLEGIIVKRTDTSFWMEEPPQQITNQEEDLLGNY